MKNPIEDRGFTRVFVGGGSHGSPKYLRPSYRYYGFAPTVQTFNLGFRIVRNKQ